MTIDKIKSAMSAQTGEYHVGHRTLDIRIITVLLEQHNSPVK